MKADIRIKNGRVIDPLMNYDGYSDIWISGNRIIEPTDRCESIQELDASGYIVIPGLIDMHRHLMYQGSDSGVHADLSAIPYGVTAAVDAGSAGSSNIGMLLHVLKESRITTKVQMNISPEGTVSRQYPERYEIEKWDIEKMKSVLERYSDSIIGLKMRTSKKVIGNGGLEPFYASVKLARKLEQRLTVHVTNATGKQWEIADTLDKGDIYCHMYHNRGQTTILSNGKIHSSMWHARNRGVKFDMAHGGNNFSFSTAVPAIAEGFLPEFISSDHTIRNFNWSPTYNLPYVMSKMMCAGMELFDVIRCVTSNPAEYIGFKDQGSLKNGMLANVAIFRIKEIPHDFLDCDGNIRRGYQQLIPYATILEGDLLYRNPEFL